MDKARGGTSLGVTFGCCLSVGSFVPQSGNESAAGGAIPARIREGLSRLADCGYDFAELTVQSVAGLTDSEYEELQRVIDDSPIKVPVLNSFIPGHLNITGNQTPDRELEAFVVLAMERVKGIGASQIVFGSGKARSLPEGFPLEQGMEQIKAFLRLCNKLGAQHGITIAIEPLNRKESNVINRVSEAVALAGELNLPQIKVLADSYHMDLENESFDSLHAAIKDGWISHVHISGRNRKFPGTESSADERIDFAALFRVLQEAGYTGAVSAECSSSRFAEDCAASLKAVKEMWQGR
jgi:sugar phosphate isomerase/epimerase